jgi:hypothetical protein
MFKKQKLKISNEILGEAQIPLRSLAPECFQNAAQPFKIFIAADQPNCWAPFQPIPVVRHDFRIFSLWNHCTIQVKR